MRLRLTILSVIVVVVFSAVLPLVQQPQQEPFTAQRDRHPAPTAGEEAGEATDGSTISARAVDVPLAVQPRSSRPTPAQVKPPPPSQQQRVSPARHQRRSAQDSGPAPVSHVATPSPYSIPEASMPVQPEGPAADQTQPETAANPIGPPVAVLTPPVLLNVPAAASLSDEYRILLPSGALTPQVVRDALQGRVVLRILVLADGRVGRVEVAVSSGSIALDDAAVAAARSWRFAPATRDGQPIDAWALMPVRFVVP